MSRTSDGTFEPLLTRGAAAGMSQNEVARWRQLLDPVELDTCGCIASARVATVAAVAWVVLVPWHRFRAGRGSLLAVGGAAATIGAKLDGQRRGKEREDYRLSALEGRVLQLESR